MGVGYGRYMCSMVLVFVAALILINSFPVRVEARLYLPLLGICKIKYDDLWHIIWHAVENGIVCLTLKASNRNGLQTF